VINRSVFQPVVVRTTVVCATACWRGYSRTTATFRRAGCHIADQLRKLSAICRYSGASSVVMPHSVPGTLVDKQVQRHTSTYSTDGSDHASLAQMVQRSEAARGRWSHSEGMNSLHTPPPHRRSPLPTQPAVPRPCIEAPSLPPLQAVQVLTSAATSLLEVEQGCAR
jgi:hypothetical protein